MFSFNWDYLIKCPCRLSATSLHLFVIPCSGYYMKSLPPTYAWIHLNFSSVLEKDKHISYYSISWRWGSYYLWRTFPARKKRVQGHENEPYDSLKQQVQKKDKKAFKNAFDVYWQPRNLRTAPFLTILLTVIDQSSIFLKVFYIYLGVFWTTCQLLQLLFSQECF